MLFEGSPRDAAGDGEAAPGNGSPAPAQPAVEVGAAAPTSEGAASADDLPF